MECAYPKNRKQGTAELRAAASSARAWHASPTAVEGRQNQNAASGLRNRQGRFQCLELESCCVWPQIDRIFVGDEACCGIGVVAVFIDGPQQILLESVNLKNRKSDNVSNTGVNYTGRQSKTTGDVSQFGVTLEENDG